MNSLQNFFKAGITEKTSKTLAEKIYLSNVFSMLIISLVGIPFIIIAWLEAPPLLFIPVGGVVAVAFVPFINRFGFYNLSRLSFSAIILMAVFAFQAYAVSEGGTHLLGMTMIQVGFTLVVFTLFTLKEWPQIVLCVVPSVLSLLFFDSLNELMDLPVDDQFLREGFYFYLSLIVGLLTIFSCMLGLIFMQNTSENKNQSLIGEMKEQQNVLQNREKELQNNLQELKKAQKTEELRQHYAEGIAHFSHILRQHEELETLGDALVSELCKFLQANQAGFFVVDRENEALELKAAYAYNRKKYLNKSVAFGEGLVGQAYLEKDSQYLTEVPKNYVNITSGLGKAPPRSILIVPFKFQDEVEAIIELASFNEFSEHEIEFLEKTGAAIAATLHNLKIQKQTKRLLEEAQDNAEMVNAQEEELRQNMEELTATQEQVYRKEQEYVQKIRELEEKIAHLLKQ